MNDGRNRIDPAGTARARTVTLPAQEEQAPARQEYGRSMPASCEIERGTIGGSDGQRARRDRSDDGLAQSPRGPARSE